MPIQPVVARAHWRNLGLGLAAAAIVAAIVFLYPKTLADDGASAPAQPPPAPAASGTDPRDPKPRRKRSTEHVAPDTGRVSRAEPQRGAGRSTICSRIGRTTGIDDETRDVVPNMPAPKPPPPPPGTDLRAAWMAHGGGKVCAEFLLASPPTGIASFELLLRERGQGDSGALVVIEAGIADGRSAVGLSYPGASDGPDARVPGDVRIEGNRLAVIIATSVLPEHTPLDQEWEAKTIVLPPKPQGSLQYYDCAPEGDAHVLHPGGRLVTYGPPGRTC